MVPRICTSVWVVLDRRPTTWWQRTDIQRVVELVAGVHTSDERTQFWTIEYLGPPLHARNDVGKNHCTHRPTTLPELHQVVGSHEGVEVGEETTVLKREALGPRPRALGHTVVQLGGTRSNTLHLQLQIQTEGEFE